MQEGGKTKMGYPGVRLRVKTAETQGRKVGAEAIWFFQTMFYRTPLILFYAKRVAPC